MKPTDVSMLVTSFLTHHLAAQRNLSPNTIKVSVSTKLDGNSGRFERLA